MIGGVQVVTSPISPTCRMDGNTAGSKSFRTVRIFLPERRIFRVFSNVTARHSYRPACTAEVVACARSIRVGGRQLASTVVCCIPPFTRSIKTINRSRVRTALKNHTFSSYVMMLLGTRARTTRFTVALYAVQSYASCTPFD